MKRKLLKSLERLKKLGKMNNDGMTMAELIVTFVLLSIFMMAAVMVIASISNIYYQAKGETYGMQVSNIVMTKIQGELESAQTSTMTSDAYGEDGAMFFYDDENGRPVVEFKNAEGSHVRLGLYQSNTPDNDGRYYLNEYYYEISHTNPSTGAAETQFEAIDWHYDEAIYVGYSISDIQFSIPGGNYENNIVQVDLSLYSPKYGEYNTTRYIECYNFDSPEKMAKIRH